MKVIVVKDPVLGKLLSALIGLADGPEKSFLDLLDAPVNREEVKPGLVQNPDFYTKPDVPKMQVMKVASKSHVGMYHTVSVDIKGYMYCTCKGFKYRGHCRHLDVAHDAEICLDCQKFSRDERFLRRGKSGCSHPFALVCPPVNGCKWHQRRPWKPDFDVKKDVPMTFPQEGALIQTFQSRHFPEVTYEVKVKNGELVCSCRGFNFHGNCKHVEYMKQRINRGTISI